MPFSSTFLSHLVGISHLYFGHIFTSFHVGAHVFTQWLTFYKCPLSQINTHEKFPIIAARPQGGKWAQESSCVQSNTQWNGHSVLNPLQESSNNSSSTSRHLSEKLSKLTIQLLKNLSLRHLAKDPEFISNKVRHKKKYFSKFLSLYFTYCLLQIGYPQNYFSFVGPNSISFFIFRCLHLTWENNNKIDKLCRYVEKTSVSLSKQSR